MDTTSLDRDVEVLRSNKDRWANDVSIAEKIGLLKEVRARIGNIADRWVEKDLEARSVPRDNWDSHTSVLTGPAISLRLLRLYIKSLESVEKSGRPSIPGPMLRRGQNQVAIQVFPTDLYDKILLGGITAEVWLDPRAGDADLAQMQASAYQKDRISGKSSLILGAGNVSGISIADILYKLIVEKKVVLVKVHPVIEYMEDIISYAFHSLITKGFVKVVRGGADVGDYLCKHLGIDEIHLTGSLRTYEQICSGIKSNGQFAKPVTAELGNISPVIIVPGPWSEADFRYQAESIVYGLINNCGFNCLANRILVQQESTHRNVLLDRIQRLLLSIPPNAAYYPGAEKTIRGIVAAYPDAQCFGHWENGKVPWTLVTDLDAENMSQRVFQEETFGPFLGETSLGASNPVDYIEKAVHFCNNTLWGSLNATLIVHPKSLQETKVKGAVEKAIADLRYGTVCLNQFPGISYYIGTTSWGGFPDYKYPDIQSGNGVVHNTYMFDKVQKTVLRGKFKLWPKPFWFPSQKRSYQIARRYLEFEKKQSLASFLSFLWSVF